MNARQRFLVVDLEATCWERDAPAPNEIIEIGSVLHEASTGDLAEFQTFVRPVQEPILSTFCRQLTHIRQEDVDAAPLFPEALAAWTSWADPYTPCVLASWGFYDRKQLGSDCARHGVAYPFIGHVNIKAAFARLRGVKPCGMAGALVLSGLTLEGTHHRGIDDARNISRLLAWLLARFGVERVIEVGVTEPIPA